MDEDRLDRNNRNASENAERIKDQLYELGKNVAVVTNELKNLSETVKKGLDNVDTTFRDFNSRYATKEDTASLAKDITELRTTLSGETSDIRKNLMRGVWIVLTAVIVGALAAAFKSGVLHAG